MAAKKKAVLPRTPDKNDLSGGGGKAGANSDLKGGGAIKQPASKKKK